MHLKWPEWLPSPNDKLIGHSLVAILFTLIRTVVRQEWKSAGHLLIVTASSTAMAIWSGFYLESHKVEPTMVYAGVALMALLAHDIVKVVLNFGEAAAQDREYGKRIVDTVMGRLSPAAPAAPTPETPSADKPKESDHGQQQAPSVHEH